MTQGEYDDLPHAARKFIEDLDLDRNRLSGGWYAQGASSVSVPTVLVDHMDRGQMANLLAEPWFWKMSFHLGYVAFFFRRPS
jgi:hypothetical protein